MSSARKKQPKGMSPKHVRKAHIVRSSGNDDPIFCGTTFDKYYPPEPQQHGVGPPDEARFKLDHLDAEAAAAETSAKRQLFGNPPGSSAAHATSGSPMKKKKIVGVLLW
eukprot:scaffold84803_cov33-Phaeocystis_antarctica.AAC.3